ncbi:MAG TPA: ABC transporter permease subunit [Candidatus Limnocylindrales bacterium]|nr:ABC transporter permease subunit [Candidatus Limnocylindrales bacterium]
MSSQGNPWFSWDYIQRNLDTLLDALRQHIFLTVASVVIAAVIAIALAILAHRVGRLAGPFLVATGTLYTIPSLALYAFLAPFTGLNEGTVLIGLVLYALLILLRAALTGLQQVPRDVREVAAGMGYGPAAMLWRVELPLALPSIMTGLRIATVSTVALVTVGDIVGIGGFGSLILSGFRNNFYRAQIMTATLATVLLALILDALLVLITYWVTPWTRGRRASL